jgi:hypothetical protein
MKPGTRLKSAVCDTEVMVIRAGEGTVECGGSPMAESKQDGGEIAADRAGGTFELLCVKPGKGTLSVDGAPLSIKDSKPLPASD